MANITKRVQRKAGKLLDPGETVEVALLVEPKGTYGAGSFLLAAAPRSQGRHLERNAAAEAADEGGIAATFPAASCAVVVTQTRVLAIESNGIGFSSVDFSTPRAGTRLVDVRSAGLGRRLTLGFADGTQVVVDAQRGQPLGGFEEALGGRIG